MDPRYLSDSQYFNAAYAPTGLTPYLNGAMNEQNIFDSEYAAHSMEHNDFSAQAMSLPMYPMPSSSSSDMSYNPQLLGTSGRSSSSSSSSQSPTLIKQEHAGGPVRSRSKVSQQSTIPEVPEEDADPSNSIKRSKFLERNRLAAAKCRTKKKRWTNNLEAAARQASQQTRELHAIVQNLRDEVMQHKTALMAHQGCDCHEVQNYLLREHSDSSHSSSSSTGQ
ncbi:protein of unknown function [Taphrina deformans PYCC 5710]|uniref:BZIP domain-containing protein n=1 Tax=Taphrina deformans (strain PYCC 5710 / ATCC 11124 / CBS 356.35 / IMI 108563 / JCM 9778 / NBRC 8474) TaxID=1097556 RepID=R4XF79_TAPDE|nr:protein of unknown function [Taphrina deformans PYCC 5710]|eukprot:CCG84527.1 protein of unknown function [Taphrina deformans PYCC 5710]